MKASANPSIPQSIKEYLGDFMGLFFPRLCAACGNHLVSGEQMVCLTCYHDLPFTHFHLTDDNLVAKRFWGRANIHAATSLLHFQKGNKVQQLVHQLKYKGKEDLGIYLGEILGNQLKEADKYQDVAWVVPVPLHWRKRLKRGYNQSASFGEGIANALGTQSTTDLLRRATHTQTQTKKTREERWLNVKDVFELRQPQRYAGSHVLLVDDVITTGATLEACAQKLIEGIPDVRVSIATIAVAE